MSEGIANFVRTNLSCCNFDKLLRLEEQTEDLISQTPNTLANYEDRRALFTFLRNVRDAIHRIALDDTYVW
jgi:excinuclease UvrABC nuclease subunit